MSDTDDYGMTAQFCGVVVRPAEVRFRILASTGDQVPVLCLEVALDNQLWSTSRFEQAFQPGTYKQCKAAARRFKPGMRVTLKAPANGWHLFVPNLQHVHVHPTTEPTSA
jgi:hypothetical protein